MAKDGEVALLLQPYNEVEMLIVWGRQLDQVADAMIKAVSAVRISRTFASFPWETCLTSPWVFFYSSYPSVDGSPVLGLLLRLRHLRARAP